MEPRTEYINGILHVVYDDGEAIPFADVMKFNYPDMDFDPATGEATGPMTPPRANAPQSAATGPTYEFGDVGRRAGNENLSAAYDALGSAMQPGTYDPIKAVNNYVGNMGAAGLLGAIGAGEKLGGYAADALGAGYEALGGERWQPGGAAGALYGDMAAGMQAAGVGPEARMLDAMGLLGAGRSARDAAKTTARGFLADESGALRFSNALPEPRNEAEAIAKTILELRATGNVDAVTERMMDAADPQYMYAYTPLPMDEASRMARAREMGAVDEYHGTTSGGEMRYPSSAYGSGSRKGIGFVTSSDPYVSSSYAAPDFGGTVFPMLNRPPEGGFAVVNTNGDMWSNIPSDARVVLPNGRETTVASYASVPDDYTGGYRTDFLSRGAAIEGDGGVKFENIIDRGIHIPRVKDDPSAALEFQRESSKPSSVMFRHDTRGMRSRFARFDPMFSHLRSLSAGVAPFGLLAMPSNKEQK